MDTLSLCAALASALLHAGWNAAVKAHRAPAEAMVAQMAGAGLLALGGLAVTGLPPAAAWPWIAASTLVNVGAVRALLRAYEHGAFGTVYPVMRATGVLGVAIAAPLVFGERPGPGALAGIGLVIGALLLLTHDATRAATPAAPAASAGASPGPSPAHDFPRAALGWTLLAGGLTSLYVMVDAQGVRATAAAAPGAALAYGFAVSITNALAMGWASRAHGAPWRLVVRHWRLAAPAAVASMASYLLILWVFTRAPVAPAAALRDTSAVFAMLIAVLWLKERLPPRRLLALALVLAGVPLLRLG